MKTKPASAIEDSWRPEQKTINWVSAKFPQVEIEGTIEKFVLSALANGRMYSCWNSAFKTWVQRSIEKKWDGCAFKEGREFDPKWLPVLSEAHPYGFRNPHEYETPEVYRTELRRWVRDRNRSTNVLPIQLGGLFKSM